MCKCMHDFVAWVRLLVVCGVLFSICVVILFVYAANIRSGGGVLTCAGISMLASIASFIYGAYIEDTYDYSYWSKNYLKLKHDLPKVMQDECNAKDLNAMCTRCGSLIKW